MKPECSADSTFAGYQPFRQSADFSLVHRRETLIFVRSDGICDASSIVPAQPPTQPLAAAAAAGAIGEARIANGFLSRSPASAFVCFEEDARGPFLAGAEDDPFRRDWAFW